MDPTLRCKAGWPVKGYMSAERKKNQVEKAERTCNNAAKAKNKGLDSCSLPLPLSCGLCCFGWAMTDCFHT